MFTEGLGLEFIKLTLLMEQRNDDRETQSKARIHRCLSHVTPEVKLWFGEVTSSVPNAVMVNREHDWNPSYRADS